LSLVVCRRKRVASSLVDAMRVNFILGEYLAELDFAFSDPTINGYDFAASYLKRSDFLVYNR
jgi:N-acetyltransferase